jgi:1,4-dihydroxy-2-naphthoate polyprenyltransferase
MRNWILAARLKTLPAAIVPIWVGCVLTWKLQGSWNFWLACFTVFGAVSIQIATNLFNDAIDSAKGADTPRRLGPKRMTASGLISPKSVYLIATIFLILACACGIVLFEAVGWPILLIGIPSLYLSYGYTGGPFPLAYRGMGELFVVMFFGIISVAGTVFIQTGRLFDEAVLLGFQVGLLSAVLISINNLRDREEDKLTGKNTLAVTMGATGGKILIWLEIKVAAFSGLFWIKYQHPFLIIATIPIWILGIYLLWRIFTKSSGPDMNRSLAIAGIMLVLFAASFHFSALIPF